MHIVVRRVGQPERRCVESGEASWQAGFAKNPSARPAAFDSVTASGIYS